MNTIYARQSVDRADSISIESQIEFCQSVYEFYRDQGALMANEPSDFVGTNGCYYYKGQDSTGRKQMNLEGNHLVLAPHEGIIPSDLWLKCRNKAYKMEQQLNAPRRRPECRSPPRCIV